MIEYLFPALGALATLLGLIGFLRGLRSKPQDSTDTESGWWNGNSYNHGADD